MIFLLLFGALISLKREKSWEQMEVVRTRQKAVDLIYELYIDALESTKTDTAKTAVADTQGITYSAKDVGISEAQKVEYDYSKPFAEQLDDWEKGLIPKRDSLVVGKTPDVFLEIGFNALPVTINQTHVDYAINGTKNAEHHIGEAMLKQLPSAMENPVAIIASETRGQTSVVALLPFVKDGNTVIIPVYVDGYGRQNSIVIDSNAITSIYGRKNAVTSMLTNAIEKSNDGEISLFYMDKRKTADLYRMARVTMPKVPNVGNGFIHSIRESGSPVKPKFENVTESQQFERWFGDWQNHPKSASKVVNADGTPKVVYHGTTADFTVFEPSMGALGKGIYFSDSRDFANGYTYKNGQAVGNVMEAYIDMKNPYYVKYADNYDIEKLKSEGYDGIIHESNGMYMVFSPNQVKSATDNIGTFTNTNPDIRFSRKDGTPATEKDVQELQKRNDSLKKQLAIDKALWWAYDKDCCLITCEYVCRKSILGPI